MKLKTWVAAAAIAAASATAWALPSVQDVEGAVRQGQYAQAETMMKEVVADRPNSAKARYLYAEILARNGRFAQAREEAAAAARIDPAIGFTQPEKFRSFQELLERQAQAGTTRSGPGGAVGARGTANVDNGGATAGRLDTGATAARESAPARSSGLPGWIWIAGLGVVGFVLWKGFQKSRSAGGAMTAGAGQPGYVPGGPVGGYPPGAQAYPQQQPGYAPGVPPGGYPPGYGQPGMAQQPVNRGPGWVGTGVAAAGGVMAGMALDRMINGNSAHAAQAPAAGAAGGDLGQMSSFDQGGLNDAGRQLEDRSIDFGNGADWGGDAGGGSFDGGSSSSDDGGW